MIVKIEAFPIALEASGSYFYKLLGIEKNPCAGLNVVETHTLLRLGRSGEDRAPDFW